MVSLPPAPVHSWPLVEITALEKFIYDEETGEYPELAVGERLRLERDPENEVDSDCINVYRFRDGLRLGYVSRLSNAEIAAALDAGEVVQARIEKVEGPQRSANNQLRWRAGRAWAEFVLFRS